MNKPADFWSRRREAVAQEATAEQVADEQIALAELSEAEILQELDLPDPDTLQPGDDFSAFMAKAVPEAIRRRALRTLWRSNPVLANVDMLVDYGEDFTDSATVMANMQTAYQVGKGMLKHIEEMARQAVEPDEDDSEEEIEEEIMMAEAEPAEEPVREPNVEPAVVAEVEIAQRPRRMTFRIEETT